MNDMKGVGKESDRGYTFPPGEWETFFNSMEHPSIILDREQRVIAANPAAEKAVGKRAGEIAGVRCYEIFHCTDAPPQGCPFLKAHQSGRCGAMVMEMEALGGTFIVSCTPIYDHEGRLSRMIHVAMDVSEMKKTERALKESETRYKTLVESANEYILVVQGGKIKYGNPKVMEEYPLEDLIDKHFMEFVHETL